MIKVYYSYLRQPLRQRQFDLFLADLPRAVQASILKFKNWDDQCISLLGKLLLKQALCSFGEGEALQRLQFNAYGRPSCGGAIDFNISHSGSYVVVAVTNHDRVGVDIEQVRSIDLLDFESFFTVDEWTDIRIATQPNHRLLKFWTAKEAIAKADGRGLSIPKDEMLLSANFRSSKNERWYLKQLDLFENCIVHLAAENEIDKILLTELFYN